MPAFYNHTITIPEVLRKQINEQKAVEFTKPVGKIAGDYDKEWGYDGKTYYLSFGVCATLAFGKMHLSLDEAKQAYNAIEFAGIDVRFWDYDQAKKDLRESRKQKLQGDDLMFFFADRFEIFELA